MSSHRTIDIPCPRCKVFLPAKVYSSVSASDADLVRLLKNRSINVVACNHCGNRFDIQTELLYVDHDRQFAVVMGGAPGGGMSEERAWVSAVLGDTHYLARPHQAADWDDLLQQIDHFERAGQKTTGRVEGTLAVSSTEGVFQRIRGWVASITDALWRRGDGVVATDTAPLPPEPPPTDQVVPATTVEAKPAIPIAGASSVPKAVPVGAGGKVQYKSDWKDIQVLVRSNGVKVLYHFTDRQNLGSIKECGGLYSWEYCEQNGIRIHRPGGNTLSRNLDSRRGLGDYVRLSFVKDTPMLYVARIDGRLKEPVLLEIDPEVIYWQETLYSDGNATSNRAVIGGDINHFKSIRFAVLQKPRWTTEDEKHYWQAEVLVKRHLPLRFIRNAS